MLRPKDIGNPSTLPLAFPCATVSPQTLVKSCCLLGSRAEEL